MIEDENKPKDMSGDPVYDYLKQHVLPGFSLIGGVLKRPRFFGAKDARMTMELYLKADDDKDERPIKYSYNYKRIKRELIRRDKRGE